MTDRELLNVAEEASQRAYAPYSKFSVGAAVECSDGSVFTGCNIENAALGCTICAERAAVCQAINAGHKDFVRMAVHADGENYCMPCGSCRQVLAEFAPDMELLCSRAGGGYVSYPLSRLLPFTFNY